MIKEKYIERKREINLGLTNGEITSVIKKNIAKSACRVYENGYIGIAGTLGEPDEKLMEQAEEKLKLQIPYEPEATKGAVRAEHQEVGRLSIADSAAFLKAMEETIGTLKQEYPQFLFNNKVRIQEIEEELSNDAGTDLAYSDRLISLEILVKHVDSVSVFDDFIVWMCRDFEREAFLQAAREQLDAFLHPVELPDAKKLPVIVDSLQMNLFTLENLSAKQMGYQTSAFNGKLGEKLFDEKFSLLVDRSAKELAVSFFDAEGSTIPEDKCYLVKNGVLIKPYADKKQAAEFGYENTATAAGEYDSVPGNSLYCVTTEATAASVKELTAGEDAIYISSMSGGDYTADGNYASPVQVAYLYRDGKLVGKLPEFSVTGKLYEMFGEDYIGAAEYHPFERKLVLRMNICRGE